MSEHKKFSSSLFRETRPEQKRKYVNRSNP